MTLEGNLRLRRGDVAAASDSYLDAVHLGRQIGTGQPLIGTLVSIACQAIGRRPLWDNMNRLNAAQAKAASRRMEISSTDRVPFAETVREQKYLIQSALIEMFRDPEKWTREAGDDGTDGKENRADESSGNAAGVRMLFLIYGKRRILDNCTRYMDELAKLAARPYRAGASLPSLPRDPINAELLPVVGKARIKSLENETQAALLTVALALRAYRLERARYPEDLTQLVPEYLRAVPNDPFGAGGALQYRPDGDFYLLYSVGPDGIDNAGRAIDNTGEIGSKRRFVNPESKGDVVAGVNVY
jgi:hypothetical protein